MSTEVQPLDNSQHDAKLPVIRWEAFNEQKPPLYTTVCMCYKGGRLDGGVFNSKDEIRMWEESYHPVAWFVVPLPSFLRFGYC